MISSLTEFDYIKKENNIYIRDKDIIKLLLLKPIFSEEDIEKLSETFRSLTESKI